MEDKTFSKWEKYSSKVKSYIAEHSIEVFSYITLQPIFKHFLLIYWPKKNKFWEAYIFIYLFLIIRRKGSIPTTNKFFLMFRIFIVKIYSLIIGYY